jgi:hypothetical protein
VVTIPHNSPRQPPAEEDTGESWEANRTQSLVSPDILVIEDIVGAVVEVLSKENHTKIALPAVTALAKDTPIVL